MADMLILADILISATLNLFSFITPLPSQKTLKKTSLIKLIFYIIISIILLSLLILSIVYFVKKNMNENKNRPTQSQNIPIHT